MAAIGHFAPLACDGCFVGVPAVMSLVIAVVILVGSVYILLAADLGVRQGYLVLMVSLTAWMTILSAIWLFGAPGTTTATGPRGREPAWIPFTPTSQVAQEDFLTEIAQFPSGWDKIGKMYPGKIESRGELETIRTTVTDAEVRLTGAPWADWAFRSSDVPMTSPDEQQIPAAEVRFVQKGSTLLFGAVIPATTSHPQTTVFAYRDKGMVFLHALYSLVASLALLVLHLWLLVRFEKEEKRRTAELTPEPVLG